MKALQALFFKSSSIVTFHQKLSALRSFAASAEGQFGTPKVYVSPFREERRVPPWRRKLARFLQVAMPLSGCAVIYYAMTAPPDVDEDWSQIPIEVARAPLINRTVVLTNWSGTHSIKPKYYFQPEGEPVVDEAVKNAHKYNLKMHMVGSGLSPNGMGFSADGVVSLARMNKILSINEEKMQVTVQAGARVFEVKQALAEHGLTLANFASIDQQQIGGFTQVGAHGTGARIPPVDDQIVRMRLVTPSKGPMMLSSTENPELFALAKVGLGCLGVVTQVTLQAVPRVRLLEHTFTASRKEVWKHHAEWLAKHQHLKYLWIPNTDTVVIITADPIQDEGEVERIMAQPPSLAENQRLAPLKDLYRKKIGGDSDEMTIPQLRDALLAVNPLNRSWVDKVNAAEAEVWKRSSGYRQGWADEILDFECGGQQWVMEVAFPVGSLEEMKATSRQIDLDFMDELLASIRRSGTPAPSPIEQRWTSSSSSVLSPASASVAGASSVHSWVGIIMYLPDGEQQRTAVTEAFRKYSDLVESMMPRYNAVWHWAKLEVREGASGHRMEDVRARLAARYPLERLTTWRQRLDPNNVMGNDWLDAVMPVGTPPEKQATRQSTA